MLLALTGVNKLIQKPSIAHNAFGVFDSIFSFLKQLVDLGNKLCYTVHEFRYYFSERSRKMEEEIYRLMTGFLEKQEVLNQTCQPERLSGYGTTELHVLKAIFETEDPNVTSLAKALRLTKGAICRTIHKLTDKRLVESYMKEGNRQKIYYRITPAGKKVYEKHEMRDNGWKQINHEFLTRLSVEEMRNAASYLQRYNAFLEQMIELKMNCSD